MDTPPQHRVTHPLAGDAVRVAWPDDAEAVFEAIAGRRHPVWLDSAGGPPALARWRVLTAEPCATLVHEGDETRLTDAAGRTLGSWRGDPLRAVRECLARFPCPDPVAGALPFGPGLYGYLGYDVGRYIEPAAGAARPRAVDLPDLWLGVYEAALVLDHERCEAYLVGGRSAGREGLEEALAHPEAADACDVPPPAGPIDVDLDRAAYVAAVARAREYIAAGDIFQVNLARRLSLAWDTAGRGPPHALYRRLRRANPAPYAAYVGLGEGRAVLSSSPELFLACDGQRVVTRPIKGTRPRRPRDEAFSRAMRDELIASAKDRAELVMIVDLERNDLGRVARYGSVRVAEARAVEAYASVWHTVATVEAELRPEHGLVALLAATLPGGSITGAPKVRAMQIIAELEPAARGVYTGAVGYLGPGPAGEMGGRCRLNVAIRTLQLDGRRLHLQVGGGIVADSDPDAEFEETSAKAAAMLRALG